MLAGIEILRDSAERLFNRSGLLSLWQDCAEHFYVERADFTTRRSLGAHLADHLTTSQPLLARRTLGDSIATMLRSREVEWVRMTVEREETLDHEAKEWLEWANQTMLRAMYDPASGFVRATKETDHDFITFGNAVISTELDVTHQRLVYRNHHLRDFAWDEGMDGKPVPVFHRFERPLHQLAREYGADNLPPPLREKLKDRKELFGKHKLYHCVVPNDGRFYEPVTPLRRPYPYISVTFDCETGHIIREMGSWTPIYTIPRWSLVSGYAYGYSPATINGMPDGRLVQQMSLVLLEAGEKAVNPPLIATHEVVRSDLSVMPGGVTWIDAEYDERLGDALRPMSIDSRGIPFGMDMQERTERTISQAFYLDSIGLPPISREMTAFEVAERIREYVRRSLPLFQPIETEYNAPLCEQTFELLLRGGAFGPPDTLPQALRGQEIKFTFRSPLHDNLERQKVQKYQETQGLLANAAALDPAVMRILDVRKATRDTLSKGVGVPEEWLRGEDEIAAEDAAARQQQELAQTLALMQQGGQAAEQIGRGGQALQGLSQQQ